MVYAALVYNVFILIIKFKRTQANFTIFDIIQILVQIVFNQS